VPGGGGAGHRRFDGAQSVEELRRSIRERARRFVQEHATPLPRRAPHTRLSSSPPPRLADRPEKWASDEADWGRRALWALFGLMLAGGALAVMLLVIAGMHGAIFGW